MSDPVSTQLDDGIATITLDDGKVNCLSPRMIAAVNAALDRAEEAGAVPLLIGREGKFSAGFDLSVVQAGGGAARDMLTGGFLLAERLRRFPTPVLIACSGHALAMGCFLLLAADYRIGIEGPFKIGANEVAIGMTLPCYAVELCRSRLAAEHLHRAAVTAEVYTPAGAMAAGYLDEVVAADALLERARAKAAQLRTLDMASYRTTKQRVQATSDAAFEAAIAADRAAIENDALI